MSKALGSGRKLSAPRMAALSCAFMLAAGLYAPSALAQGRQSAPPSSGSRISTTISQPYKIGQIVRNKGLFIGAREMIDQNGDSLGIFDLYTSPEDLGQISTRRLTLAFNDAVEEVASLRNWHGHNGGRYVNAQALYKSMKDGTYKGEWFIPPADILEQNLFMNRDKGWLWQTFAGTFSGGYERFYWSSTEVEDSPYAVYASVFPDMPSTTMNKYFFSLSTRPVRAEKRMTP